jgi:quinol monooxygenase YgiN
MYSRVITAQVLPDKLEEAIRVWRDTVVPANIKKTGWVSARMIVNRQTNKAMVIAIWESEDALQESGGTYLQIQFAKFVELLASPPVEEIFEVAAEG